jgi:flagellar biosynthesis anti-sigma factor FlgM
MQISSFSISPSISPVKTTAAAASKPTSSPVETDASFTTSAASFSSLVQQASATPDVRTDLVNSFKARIAAGQYPTSETIDSLAETIGGSIIHMAEAAQD